MTMRAFQEIYLSKAQEALGKQFVLSICTDGMQLIPTHQIVDVLTGTIKNAARLGCADNAVLHVMMQCVYR